MEASNNLTLEFIAIMFGFIGVVISPLVAYYAAKRKIGAEILLINIDTIKGWSEARKSFETEIAELHDELNAERLKRREERVKYEKKIEDLKAEIKELTEKLEDCTK